MPDIKILDTTSAAAPQVLTREALALVEHLHKKLDACRQQLTAARAERHARIEAGEHDGERQRLGGRGNAHYGTAVDLLDDLPLSSGFNEFLTLDAYSYLA